MKRIQPILKYTKWLVAGQTSTIGQNSVLYVPSPTVLTTYFRPVNLVNPQIRRLKNQTFLSSIKIKITKIDSKTSFNPELPAAGKGWSIKAPVQHIVSTIPAAPWHILPTLLCYSMKLQISIIRLTGVNLAEEFFFFNLQ
jgi:hypothetical protein